MKMVIIHSATKALRRWPKTCLGSGDAIGARLSFMILKRNATVNNHPRLGLLMTNRQKYFLVQDNSCHWYVIPEDKKDEWDTFCDLPEDDEASWEVPEFARDVDGPHSVAFYLD
jgi:hypothetical protein